MFEIPPFIYLKELLMLVLTGGASILIDFSSNYNEDNLLSIFDNHNYNEESATKLGIALYTYGVDKDSGILLLSKILEDRNNTSKQVAMATLVNHYYSNEQFFEVDSLFNIGIEITDNVLSSKLLMLQGDMRINNEEYDLAIELYQGSIDEVSSPEVEVKLAQAYYEAGNSDKAKEIVESLLEDEKASSTVKRKLSTLKSRLDS